MREYELFYLVSESKESELVTIRQEVETLFREEGAAFLELETTDKRKLAYPIAGEIRGFYIARRFTLPDKSEFSSEQFEKEEKEDVISRLNRKLTLSKSILRVLLLRADALPPLKPIERTEYVRSEARSRGGHTPAPHRPNDAPNTADAEKDMKPVSKEQIDKQLEEVLHI